MMALQPIIAGVDSAIASAIESALQGLSPCTRRAYNAHIKRWLAWATGATGNLPHALDRTTVKAYIRGLEIDGASAQVRNQALAALKKLAHECGELGWIEPSIAAQVQSIKSKRALGVRVGKWLTIEQTTALLASPDSGSAQGRRDRTILALLVGCGLRRSEACNLTVDQVVVMDDRTILRDVEGKGGRVRSIAVPKWAAQIINEWIREITK